MKIERPAGQPPKQPEEQKYITQKGDTLRLVAQRFDVNALTLQTTNKLQIAIDDKLDAGRELLIPLKETLTPPPDVTKDLLEVVKDRFNPFESPVESPGVEATWGESKPSWTEVDPAPWGEVKPPWSEAAPQWIEGSPQIGGGFELPGQPGSEPGPEPEPGPLPGNGPEPGPDDPFKS